jgi:serine protease Do
MLVLHRGVDGSRSSEGFEMMGRNSLSRLGHDLPRVAILLGVSAAFAIAPFSSAFAQGNAASPAQEPLPSFAPIAATVLPAVVNISVVQKPEAAPVADEEDAPEDQPREAPPGQSPYNDLMRRFFEQQQGRAAPGPREHMMALGSGFIIDPAGYVVTNNHVVGNAAKVTVVFQDGSEHRAKIVGTDAKTDLALLKIDAPKPLPFVEWGDSD